MKLMMNLKYFKNIFYFKSILKYLPELFVFFFFIHMLNAEAKDVETNNTEHQGDTIQFSGYEWVVKESFGKQTGPGNNYFSGSKDNIFVDSIGKLHLRITHRNEKWYCPELRMLKNLGSGKYSFFLDPLPQPLDKDVVIGLFLYDRDDTSNFHKEIDIEISKWGIDTSKNTQFVIQPKETEAYRFQSDLNLATRQSIELGRKKITFKSFYDAPGTDDIPLEYSNLSIKPEYNYKSTTEKISINVWLYRTSEPYSLKEFEVVFSKFEFKPFWYNNIFNFLKKKKK